MKRVETNISDAAYLNRRSRNRCWIQTSTHTSRNYSNSRQYAEQEHTKNHKKEKEGNTWVTVKLLQHRQSLFNYKRAKPC